MPSHPPLGTPERRRTHGRRMEDDAPIPEDVERGIRIWLKIMFAHRVKIMALGALLGTPLGFLGGCATGLREALSLKTQVGSVTSRVTKLEEAAGLQSFLLCYSMTSPVPPAVSKACNEIISRGVAPHGGETP